MSSQQIWLSLCVLASLEGAGLFVMALGNPAAAMLCALAGLCAGLALAFRLLASHPPHDDARLQRRRLAHAASAGAALGLALSLGLQACALPDGEMAAGAGPAASYHWLCLLAMVWAIFSWAAYRLALAERLTA